MRLATQSLGAALALVPVLLWPVAALSQSAPAPSSAMSVAEIVRALMGREPRYSYTPTAPPAPGTGLCAGQAVVGAPRLTVEAVPSSEPTVPAVPYNPGTGASVQFDVQFDGGSDRIRTESQQLLGNLATALKDPATASGLFAVAGHADVSGNEPKNRELSCARAIAVRNFLISSGVPARQLTAYGFGSSQLLPGHAPNAVIHRRVEIRRAR